MTSVRSHDKVTASAARQYLSFSLYKCRCRTGCLARVNSEDLFCYACGEVTLASQRRSIMPLIKEAYHLYFGCKLGDQEVGVHTVCNTSWRLDKS